MNGAESLVRTLLAGGVDHCFTNPGTSEMHFVAALDRVPQMRCILGLFEGVVTGAADGFYRMSGRPASVLLHLGPGLANGLANLHNARRARSGIINIVGEHATWHLAHDAPLTSDIEGLARPLSHVMRTTKDAGSVGADTAAIIAVAREHPGKIATLILPGDSAWNEGANIATPPPVPSPAAPDAGAIEAAARVLAGGEPTLLILAGRALRADALHLAGRIAARTGCRIAGQFFSARIERGAGRVAVERIPYAVDAALAFLSPFRHLILVETGEPVAFFAYPGKPSLLKPEGCALHPLTRPEEDSLAALEQLAEALGAKRTEARLQSRGDATRPTGPLTPQSIAQALAALIPENAILVDESITTGRETYALTADAAPHDTLQNMGGSIGFGTPVATGAAIACPDRKVICLEGDGSAMYTLQSLWTQAREGLDVTTIIFANRTYEILKGEYAGVGAGVPGARARSMLEIDRPVLDFVALARGMGVAATSVTDSDEFCTALARAVANPGPHLVEVVL
jgi:acetolactate synthase-1/2/3 large subunit